MRATLNNLSGGLTDYPHNSHPSKMVTLENFLPQPSNGLKTRPGSIIYPSALKQSTRIDSIFDFPAGGEVYEQVGNKLFTSDSTTSLKMGSSVNTGTNYITNGDFNSDDDDWTVGASWTYNTGPKRLTHAASPGGSQITSASLTKGVKYKFILKLDNSTYASPGNLSVRITDGTGSAAWEIGGTFYREYSTASYSYFYAPDDADQYNILECTSTGTVTFNIYATGNYTGDVLGIYLYAISVGTTEIFTDNSAPYIDVAMTADEAYITTTEYNRPVKMWYDEHTGTEVLRISTSGMPIPATLTTTAGDGGAKWFDYAISYRYNYNVGTLYEKYDIGYPIYSATYKNSAVPSAANNVVLTLPTLTNSTVAGSITGWDVDNVIIEIYRTKEYASSAGGFYWIGNVINGQATFNDAVADADLTELAPFESTTIVSDIPPRAKYVAITNNTNFYANTYSAARAAGRHTPAVPEAYDNSVIYQSITADNDNVPDDFYLNVDDEITGLDNIQSYLICLTKSYIYRIEGKFDEAGGGLIPVEIHRHAGCISSQSIVRSNDMLFWAGHDGFYVTNGFQCNKLPLNNQNSLNLTYKKIITTTSNSDQKLRIFGTYDYQNGRIYWTINDDQAIGDNNKILVYDITKDAFFMLVGARTLATKFNPTALLWNDTGLVYSNDAGYLFQMTEASETDVTYDSGWGTTPVISKFKHIAFDFGDSTLEKYATSVVLDINNNGNLVFATNSYDDGIATGYALDTTTFTSAGLDGRRNIKTLRMGNTLSTSSQRCHSKQLEVITTGGVMEIDKISYKYENLDMNGPSEK